MRKLLLCLTLCAPLLANGPFSWTDAGNGRWQLTEGGKPVLTYNAGPQLSNGAPDDRARCCYIYPAYTPGGVNPLDDFPKDHWHHHGLFWAWPVVEYDGQRYDLWMYKGVRHESVGDVKASGARLTTTNRWVAGDKQIVRELVTITASPSRAAARDIDVQLTLEALDKPVTLEGSREKGKSYGGFSARFAQRESTVIRTDKGTLPKDDDLTAYVWAELEAIYNGKRAALRITPDPRNEGAPHQWCLRNYGFIGASMPGRTETAQSFTIKPGTPLTLGFTVRLSDIP